VTMDQTVVEVGPVGHPSVVPVERGAEVVLIGTQDGPEGARSVTAQDWADILGTIPYEVVCGFGPRITRRHL
jgi:alanine racemase